MPAEQNQIPIYRRDRAQSRKSEKQKMAHSGLHHFLVGHMECECCGGTWNRPAWLLCGHRVCGECLEDLRQTSTAEDQEYTRLFGTVDGKLESLTVKRPKQLTPLQRMEYMKLTGASYSETGTVTYEQLDACRKGSSDGTCADSGDVSRAKEADVSSSSPGEKSDSHVTTDAKPDPSDVIDCPACSSKSTVRQATYAKMCEECLQTMSQKYCLECQAQLCLKCAETIHCASGSRLLSKHKVMDVWRLGDTLTWRTFSIEDRVTDRDGKLAAGSDSDSNGASQPIAREAFEELRVPLGIPGHFPRLRTYQGTMLGGVPHGLGKAVYISGTTTYEGGWWYGQKTGQGRYKYTAGAYHGNFRNDRPNGLGTAYNAEGKVIWTGLFSNGTATKAV